MEGKSPFTAVVAFIVSLDTQEPAGNEHPRLAIECLQLMHRKDCIKK